MVAHRSSEALTVVQRDFDIDIVNNQNQLDEVFRLRYQVYCVERHFEPGQGGVEIDAYDDMARHVLLRHRVSGQAIGTVRLVIPRLKAPWADLPMERVADLPRLRTLPRPCIAEVSRFALSKELRAASASLGCLARLALVRGIVQLSDSLGVTYWCALMEPKLLRLLAMSGIHFVPIGGLVDHHGLRQPSYVGLDDMLKRVRQEKPAVWEFITEDGRLWQAQPAAAAA
jgi:N-acyl-L-homoserine lactone synthetase